MAEFNLCHLGRPGALLVIVGLLGRCLGLRRLRECGSRRGGRGLLVALRRGLGALLLPRRRPDGRPLVRRLRDGRPGLRRDVPVEEDEVVVAGRLGDDARLGLGQVQVVRVALLHVQLVRDVGPVVVGL